MDGKRYVVTLSEGVTEIDDLLRRIEDLGAHVSTVQRLLGTAVVEVDGERTARLLKGLDGVESVTEERGYGALA